MFTTLTAGRKIFTTLRAMYEYKKYKKCTRESSSAGDMREILVVHEYTNTLAFRREASNKKRIIITKKVSPGSAEKKICERFLSPTRLFFFHHRSFFFLKASPRSAGDMREILVVEGTARDDGCVVVEEEVEQEIRRGARARHPLQNRR